MTSKSKEYCITFCPDSHQEWFIRMIRYENTQNPVFEVNRDTYPDPAPEEFAHAVLKVLESSDLLDQFIEERAEMLLEKKNHGIF